MAYGMVAEDFVAIGLLLLEGDSGRSVRELVRAAQTYQTRHGGHFGVSEDDLEGVFITLFYEAGNDLDTVDFFQRLDAFFATPFRRWARIILARYDGAYFNDEGNYWDPPAGSAPTARRERLRTLLAGEPSPLETRQALAELGWRPDWLEYFLEGRDGWWDEDSPVESNDFNRIRLR